MIFMAYLLKFTDIETQQHNTRQCHYRNFGWSINNITDLYSGKGYTVINKQSGKYINNNIAKSSTKKVR
jgi:hypothetical protein